MYPWLVSSKAISEDERIRHLNSKDIPSTQWKKEVLANAYRIYEDASTDTIQNSKS